LLRDVCKITKSSRNLQIFNEKNCHWAFVIVKSMRNKWHIYKTLPPCIEVFLRGILGKLTAATAVLYAALIILRAFFAVLHAALSVLCALLARWRLDLLVLRLSFPFALAVWKGEMVS